jgi:hypothetical protein
MVKVFALSHGPPTHVSLSVVGLSFDTRSLYGSTDVPSPGVPEDALMRPADSSWTSTVTVWAVA